MKLFGLVTLALFSVSSAYADSESYIRVLKCKVSPEEISEGKDSDIAEEVKLFIEISSLFEAIENPSVEMKSFITASTYADETRTSEGEAAVTGITTFDETNGTYEFFTPAIKLGDEILIYETRLTVSEDGTSAILTIHAPEEETSISANLTCTFENPLPALQ